MANTWNFDLGSKSNIIIAMCLDGFSVGGFFVKTPMQLVGQNDFKEQPFFKFYPNPAIEELTIDFEHINLDSFSEITIVNSLGNIVYKNNISSTNSNMTIDISLFPKGLYYIKLTGKDGMFAIQKFIKINS